MGVPSEATPTWTWPQREKLGQEFLRDLAEDVIAWWDKRDAAATYQRPRTSQECIQSLELDGYSFRGETLLAPETDVLDAKEEGGVLRDLYNGLALPNEETAFHHLELSESHYLAKRWDDSISNSRKFLEAVLQELAAAHYAAARGAPLPTSTYGRPARVRDYLEASGLIESKEKEALAAVYGLLSETGGHPYMARSEQARLLRHLALTFGQFALLRMRGFKSNT